MRRKLENNTFKANTMMDYSNWVGKKIEQCFINQEHDTMLWKVNGVWYNIFAEGDCCSSSWFEHCDNGEALQDATLNSFEDVELGAVDNSDYECLRVNMLKFATDKGYCTIEFRNSSNGYYSGWSSISRIVNQEALPDPSKYNLLGTF